MTPKEKADELVNKFAKLPEEGSLMWYLSFEIAKKCALIEVDDIIKILNPENWGLEMTTAIDMISYFQEVKQEIQAL